MFCPQKKIEFQPHLPIFTYGGLILIAFFLVVSKKIKTNQNKRDNSNSEIKNYLYPDLKVGIIMPAYNEEANIGKTLSQIPQNITEKLDVIVVDDGSTDKTNEIALQYEAITLKHPTNKGNGAAIQTGLNYCKEKGHDIVIIIDADGQHEPRYIKDFIKPIVENDYEYVIGNRFRYHYNMRLLKKVLSRIMSVILSFIPNRSAKRVN